jgi:DinB superfamily
MTDVVRRPEPAEHAPYYSRYIRLVPDGPIVETLATQIEDTLAVLTSLSPEQARYRYAPEKWTVQQVIGHVADAERVFSYRALAFARGETNELPGFDENAYAAASPAGSIALADLMEDLVGIRRATLSLFRNLTPEGWSRSGIANRNTISVRALAWVIAGHERHHLSVLRERYLKA